MKGPTKKPKRIRLGWLERFITLAGLLVVLGVWMESGRELSRAIMSRTWPRQEAVGGALVVIGVFAEVAIGLFIARSAKRAELKANEEIAEARERIAKAEQATAEANLARARLERRTARRELTDEQRNAIAEKLAIFAGQLISIRAFPADHEAIIFAHAIAMALTQAGWQAKLLQSHLFTSTDGITCTGISLLSTPDQKSLDAGLALVMEFAALADGSIGPLAVLPEPENPRLQLVVQGRDAPLRSEVA